MTILAAGSLAGCAGALPPVGQGRAGLTLEDDERRLWNRSREEQQRLDRSGLLYQDRELAEHVNRVADRLLPTDVRAAGLDVEVRLIKNPALNAFAYPNGVIYVHTGILARMDNDAQLATLLAHELTHATHRHLVRSFRDLRTKAAVLATFQVMTIPLGAVGTVASLLGALGTLAAVSGYSQELETEADLNGLSLMIRAGYDPREAPALFLHLKQWAAEEQKPEPFFFNTHPRLAERVENYQDFLRREWPNLEGKGPYVLGEEAFRARIRGLLFDNALLDLQAGRFLQAQKGLTKYLAMDAEDARAYHYLAEVYRRRNDPKDRPEALRLYQAALALDPQHAEAYRGLGTLHYQAGKTADAAKAFERYLELVPAAQDRGYIEALLEEMRG